MSTLNKVTLIGYLGRDPEIRATANGDLLANMTVATTETWKDKATGEKREATEWHRVVLYRKLADVASQYLKKGSLVYIEGKLHTRKFTGRDEIERTVVEIVADDMRMLGGKSSAMLHEQEAVEATSAPAPAPARSRARRPAMELDDEAIPF